MLKRLLFALVPALILFGVVEMVLRVTGWPEVTEAFEHNEPFWVVDPDLNGYAMPHNEENTSFAVSTNSDGLRTTVEVTDSKKSLRVMTLGCSTTFGWGVADVETYPARLQHYLTESGYGNERVVNGGQPVHVFQETGFGMPFWTTINPTLFGWVYCSRCSAAYSDRVKRSYKGTIDF